MTRINTATRLRLAAAALLASLFLNPAIGPATTSADPPPVVDASTDTDLLEPGGFEIDGEPDGVDSDGTLT